MVKPQGLDRLLRQIGSLDKVLIADVAEALGVNADQLAKAIKAAAPRGKTGRLAESVRVTDTETTRSGAASVKGAKGLSKRVTAGSGGAFYARFVEYGTKAAAASRLYAKQKGKWRGRMTQAGRPHAATRAQPFFWPTVRAYKKLMKTRIVRASNKSAKRLGAVR